MHSYHAFFKIIWQRAFAAALLALLPLGPLLPARNTPPPPVTPRYVPVPGDAHVIAVWADENGNSSPSQPVSAAAAAGDTSLISQTAGAASVRAGDNLHYAVTVTNATNTTQTFLLTDTLPAGEAYISGTATGGFAYDAGSNRLTASVPLPAFQGDVINVTGAPTYTEIATPGGNICLNYFPNCYNNSITLGGVPFRYLGVDYTTITLDSSGFVIPGSINPGAANPSQHLPDPTAPNNVIAPFWSDLDLKGNASTDTGRGEWYYGVLQSSANIYLVVEWHDAQLNGDNTTHYSFQVWIQLYTEHITFAYLNLTGPTTTTSIGFENSDGTLGASYLYHGDHVPPGPGTQLQINGRYTTAALGYSVKASQSLRGCSRLTNTVNLAGTRSDSATTTTAVFGPCLFLPAFYR